MSKENPFIFTRANCEVVSEFARSNSLLKQTINSEFHWNRITILNGTKYDKTMILELIVSSVHPYELFPCMYREEDDDTFFLFQNGFSVVMVLCARKLFLVHPETDENIELTITAQYTTIAALPFDPMRTLEEVIVKRISDDKKVLNLRNLSGDPDMVDLYCSFNCPKFWELVFQIKGKHMTPIHSWLLSCNNITLLSVLDPISKFEVPTLDLRYNRITTEGFRKINKSFQIENLLIEGNPITSEFETTWALSKFVTSRINIKTLDFLNVDEDSRSLRCNTFPNYLIEPSYKNFVDHFMFHSFKWFERDANGEKQKVAIMYHEDSPYSVSLFRSGLVPLASSNDSYLASQIDSIDHNLICKDGARMIKKYDNILFGKVKIAKGITKLPQILLYYSTFSVDVPIASDKLVQIFVNGVCRSAERQKPKLYYFSRSTLLVPSNKTNGEWLISNDMWNFSHVNVKTSKIDLRDPFRKIKGDFAAMINPQLKDKEILRRLIKKLTKMKPDWVDRFLEESDWDLEFTLQSFTDQFKADVIPVNAFDIDEEKLKSLHPLIVALKEKQARLGIENI